MTKLQLTLTPQETAILHGYGDQFGYSLPKTVKLIISQAVEKFFKEGTTPTFKMSKKTEQAGLQALEEFRSGKTEVIENIDEYFDNL